MAEIADAEKLQTSIEDTGEVKNPKKEAAGEATGTSDASGVFGIDDEGRDVVKLGDKVLLVLSDGQKFLAHVKKGEQIRMKRKKYNLNKLLGATYGSVFELNNGKFEKLDDINLNPSLEDFDLVGSGDVNQERKNDNRNIIDDNTSQKLDAQDIKMLRDTKAHGAEIIKALVENSKSWNEKTEFSQQKWLKRKQNKYIPRMRVVKCSAADICDFMFEKNNAKVCNLRADSLAQLLWYADAAAGQRVLCFDQVLGVVVAALAERLGGLGTVLAPYVGQQSHFIALQHLNMPPEWQDVVVPFPLTDLGDLDRPAREHEQPGFMTEEGKKAFDARLATYAPEERERALQRRRERMARGLRRPDRSAVRRWIKEGCDSLVVAANVDVAAVVGRLWRHLHPSCPFVVFCEFLEPLQECFHDIRKKGSACKLVLAETWNREYQFLPGRSHPAMKMTANGGYVLAGVKADRARTLDFEQRSWKKQKKGR